MTGAQQPIAYLTCEIKGRDFKSRLLIAAHLVRMGYSAVVGQYWNLAANAAYAPKGVYHFKTANSIQADNMRHCKKHGHMVVASDEEAFAIAEAYAALTTDPLTFEASEIFLAINRRHARAIVGRFPAQAARIRIAGTARADLLRSTTYARPHTRPYALINTSFGWTKSVWGSLDKVIENYVNATGLDLNQPEHRRIIEARIEYERLAFIELEKVLSWLIESRRLDVIIRPHPSELSGLWERAGAIVVNKSDPHPWLKHAQVMVHTDSTTGLEAALLSAPAINLSPLDAWAERQNVRDYNITVKTADEVIAAIQAGRIRQEGDNSDLAPQNAARTTAEILAGLLPPPASVSIGPWGVTSRTGIQGEKFTVTADECVVAVNEVFPLAQARTRITQLADSVFLLQPP